MSNNFYIRGIRANIQGVLAFIRWFIANEWHLPGSAKYGSYLAEHAASINYRVR
jgi:hypothetical protein